MADLDSHVFPRKRIKLSVQSDTDWPTVEMETSKESTEKSLERIEPEGANLNLEGKQKREEDVGITNYVNPALPGFSGIFKKRYTDFLVNEIQQDGAVLRFDDLSAIKLLQPEPGVHRAQSSKHVPASRENAPDVESTQKIFKVSEADEAELTSMIGNDETKQLLDIFQHIQTHQNTQNESVTTRSMDREFRSSVHHSIRRIFESRMHTVTNPDWTITVTPSKLESERPRRMGKRGGSGADRGGGSHGGRSKPSKQGKMSHLPKKTTNSDRYLHFTLYKENQETMGVVSFIARLLNISPSHFQFAGTKDRRGVTVQRVSGKDVRVERLYGAGGALRSARIGSFEFHPVPLALGDLTGNEFVITLRECSFGGLIKGTIEENIEKASAIIKLSMDRLVKDGFLNYFGLQRFGTFLVGTHVIGMKILQGDFKGAVDAILSYDSFVLVETGKVAAEERSRAKAIAMFNETANSQAALKIMPRRFVAESSVIKFLGKGESQKSDWATALISIPRNLRSMYLHAYQSWVWNTVASERWKLHGSAVVTGDLVLINEHRRKGTNNAPVLEEVDDDGEAIVHASGDSHATQEEGRFERARALSAEEAVGGTYTIYDVVLPTPGFDILYPEYLLPFYTALMGKDEFGGLDPVGMRRKQNDFSLPGSYRKILARPSTAYESMVVAYKDEDEQLVETDVERLERIVAERGNLETEATAEDGKQKISLTVTEGSAESGIGLKRKVGGKEELTREMPDKLAVVLKLQLGSSTYATMALRELMREGGVRNFLPEYGH